jgi:hypothetical protein
VRLFHRTTEEDAAAILATGFHDDPSAMRLRHQGVWLSRFPLGPDGQVLLTVELALSEEQITSFKFEGPGSSNREVPEFLIPTALLNEHGSVRRATSAEEAEAYTLQ